MRQPIPRWKTDGDIASVEEAPLSLHIDLAKGHHSIDLRNSDGKEIASLWGLRSLRGSPLTDAYVRDHDLVASYSPTKAFPFYTQLCWTLRSASDPSAQNFAMSLLVSMRTDLLDTHPEVEINTLVPHQSLVDIAFVGGKMFWGTVNESITLIDFAATEDCREQQIVATKADIDFVQRQFFSHFLEKGVIRRARLFAAIAPADITQEQAVAIGEEFLNAELPLTT